MKKNKIVVLTHGQFGQSLIDSASMIIGQLDNVVFEGLQSDDTPESFRERVTDKIDSQTDNVLFLVDLYGGTPFHIASYFLKDVDGQVLTGVNLPMLIESYTQFIQSEKHDIEDLIKVSQEGIRYIDKKILLGGN